MTVLKVDRGRQLVAVEAGDLLAQTLRLKLLQMHLDGIARALRHLGPSGNGCIHPQMP